MLFWMIAWNLAAGYCVARAIQDLRARSYVWAALGILAAGAIFTIPIPTHAVKIEVPLTGPTG